MSLCKNGQILNCCHPNALITLEEFLQDYASDETKETGNKLIESELHRIPNEKTRALASEYVKRVKNGERDFRF